MAVTKEELESFHEFACNQVEQGDDLSIDEILMDWHDSRDRDEINSIIRQGLADIDADRGQPAREVMEELRKKYNLPTE